MKRRTFLRLAAGATVLPAVSRSAKAEAYPTRPVHIIAGFAPGGPQDIVARLMGQWLTERLGQPFVVDNRTGAAGNIAAEFVAHAPPDGYSLLIAGLSNAVNASLYRNLSFNFLRDIAPVASVMRTPGVLEVNPAFPTRTLPEFIAYAKANPGKVSMATSGSGSPSDVYTMLFKMTAGVDVLIVPYRGSGPALVDLLGNQIPATIDPIPSSVEYIRAGRLRALAVTTATRSEALPDTPSIAEFVPGFEASSWYGMAVPRNTPTEIIDTLNREIDAALADAKVKSRLADLGGIVQPGSPGEFGKFIAEETEKWAKVVRFAGMKAE
jgi:tripartite-type tricarboxylate transporter receptor subunit TctC